MGLKTTNYTIKELGITIPEAYAIINAIEICGTRGDAEFYIQATRDNAFNLKPLERKIMQFTINRDENPYITAYNTAKGTYSEIDFEADKDGKIIDKTVEKPNIFNGWEDDIQ